MRFCKWVAFLFLLFCLPSVGMGEEVRIILKEKAQVRGMQITLGEVAQIEGDNPGFVDRLASFSLGTSPSPGDTCLLDQGEIRERLTHMMRDGLRCSISGSPRVVVVPAYRDLSRVEVEEAVRDFVMDRVPESVEEVLVQVDRLPPGEIWVPEGEVELRVQRGGRMDLKGTTLFTLEVVANGQVYRRLSITANVRWFEKVAVARNRIGRHQLIKPEDLRWEKRETTYLPPQVVTQSDQVVGKRSKGVINPGRVILSDMLDLPPVIKRGDLVTIQAVKSNMTITTLGKAKRDGHLGELISVINIDSGKEVMARVKDSHTVVVWLNGGPNP